MELMAYLVFVGRKQGPLELVFKLVKRFRTVQATGYQRSAQERA